MRTSPERGAAGPAQRGAGFPAGLAPPTGSDRAARQNGAASPPEQGPQAASRVRGCRRGRAASSLRSMSDTRKAKFKKLLDQQVGCCFSLCSRLAC